MPHTTNTAKLADWLLLGGIGLISLIGLIGRISQIGLIGLIDSVVGDVGGDGLAFSGVEKIGRWTEWVLIVSDGGPANKLHGIGAGGWIGIRQY